MAIKLNTLRMRLTITLVLLVLLPTITIGWVAYKSMSETIRSERIKAVGLMADSKHDQLVMVLTRANIRAEHFLSDLHAQCNGNAGKPNHSCATGLIRAYLAAEGAIGATLHGKGGDDLTIGTSSIRNEEPVRFQTGQLAEFSSVGPDSDHSYFVSVAEKVAGLHLSITYPSSVLEPVFNPPPAELGLSGETFLADSQGYFVTKPRYVSTQGHKHPISAHPMESCLSGQSGEVLDLDYRDAPIIHGFRFIPELGSACIMAHISQDEAFAPLRSLEQKIIIAIFLFGTILTMMAVYLVRSIVKPITRLTKVTKAIAAGDYQAQADVAGHDEISELGVSFNFMTDKLQASQQHEVEALHELRVMLDTSGEGFWKVDQSGHITEVNEAYCHIAGYARDEIVGAHISKFEATKQTPETVMAHIRLITEQGYDRFETRHRHSDGHLIDVEVSCSFVLETNCLIAFLRDVTERKKAEEDINRLAFYDSLTNLPNRRLLLDRVQHALANSARSGRHGAIMFIDLDNFKVINDTKGHDFGDRILIEVARRLQSCVREGDTVARLGGDEFVVMLEDMGIEAEHAAIQAEEVGEKILTAIDQPFLIGEEEYYSTASIGISLFVDRATTSDTLLKNADIAMYQAKGSGRNAVRFFDPEMQVTLEAHTAMEADLRYALAKRQFRLYYQAQVDETGRIYGAEALIRWMHPQRGMVPPDQFIPIAEESSLILDIGQWVLETACRQLALWSKDEQKRNLVLAVNVSVRQFKAGDFVGRVAAVMREHGINPSLLKLELTESMVLHDVTDIATKMHAVKALGVGLSMDDFGTGYSSLSHLKQLPLDQLKIDRSFVRDIATDPLDATMVQTIINMGHNFRLNVIAEGVESQVQQAFLKQHGCIAYQGYLFSKPLPIEEFEQLLHSSGNGSPAPVR